MTADLTQEPKVREALDSLAHFDGLLAHFGHLYGLGWFSKDEYIKQKARQQVCREAVVAAVLAEARPQWRKQVAEELRAKSRRLTGSDVYVRALATIDAADFVEQGGEK